MSTNPLDKEKVFVLGPLEISPGHFAVGEKTYAAIKGEMPRYNAMRQEFYLNGETEAGDAIGCLEARAKTAEAALARMRIARKSAETKVSALTKEILDLEKLLKKHNIKRDKPPEIDRKSLLIGATSAPQPTDDDETDAEDVELEDVDDDSAD